MKQPHPMKAGQPNAPEPTVPPGQQQNPNPKNPTNPNPQPGSPPTQPEPHKEGGEKQAKATKSIVPHKYTSRYKNGGEDELAQFIKAECASPEGFQFAKFFELCAKNGIAQDKIDHYAKQIADKRHGAEGRARMTLRNMLATVVRKNGKAMSLSGKEVELHLPKAVLTGAAKAAQEKTAAQPAA